MERVIVNIGDKTYNCQVAKNEEDRKKGLQGVEYLPINKTELGFLYLIPLPIKLPYLIIYRVSQTIVYR